MAIYSKQELQEQVEVINMVKAILALTVLRMTITNRKLTEATKVLRRIEAALGRVFEIHPGSEIDRLNRKNRAKKSKHKPQRTLSILISANEKTYGDLVWRICNFFISDLKTSGNDALVIGEVGKKLVSSENIKSKIYYYDLDDYNPNPQVIRQIISIINQYYKVVVYHGQNESLLNQIATKSEVLMEIPEITKPSKKYIFEPTPLEVLNFLNRQVVVNTFNQKVYTTEVARLSARRWDWTKQQMARVELIEELYADYVRYRKHLLQKQQQVNVSALRLSREQQLIKKW